MPCFFFTQLKLEIEERLSGTLALYRRSVSMVLAYFIKIEVFIVEWFLSNQDGNIKENKM
jgi:hypothetical protein